MKPKVELHHDIFNNRVMITVQISLYRATEVSGLLSDIREGQGEEE